MIDHLKITGYQPIDTKIPTSKGFKLLRNIEIGDRIFGSDGKQIEIIETTNDIIKDIYRVTFNDGRFSFADEEHLWMLIGKAHDKDRFFLSKIKGFKEKYKYFSEKRFINQTHRDCNRYRYRIPAISSPVEYDNCKELIDPYVMGAFIGSRMVIRNSLSMKSKDDYVPYLIASKYQFSIKKSENKDIYKFYEYGTSVSSTHFFLNFSKMMVNTDIKLRRIPDSYLFNNVETRMQLLRGIMDNAGSITFKGNKYAVDLTFHAETLLTQVKELVMGLGFNANYVTKPLDDEGWELNNVGLRFSVPNKFKEEMFTHPIKKKIAIETRNMIERKIYSHLIIKDVEFVGEKKCRGIKVNSRDGLYLTNDFIVIHN